jgi:hypothetical protein
MVEDAVIGEIHRMIRASEITARTNGITVDLRKEGLGLVVRDMLLPAKKAAFA